MEPHRIAFKNQLEPPIKSYEYFKFEEYSDETHSTSELFGLHEAFEGKR